MKMINENRRKILVSLIAAGLFVVSEQPMAKGGHGGDGGGNDGGSNGGGNSGSNGNGSNGGSSDSGGGSGNAGEGAGAGSSSSGNKGEGSNTSSLNGDDNKSEPSDLAPLSSALRKVNKDFPGRVLGVELESEVNQTSAYIYEFKVLTPNGQVIKAEYDAVSLKLLKFYGHHRHDGEDD